MALSLRKLRSIINKKIKEYHPKGMLDHTATMTLNFMSVKHKKVLVHVMRVALYCEAVAKKLGKDTKAAFFAGLEHDTGKMLLAAKLFDGHNITAEEYAEVKTHALASYMALKGKHLFTALCAGLHHAMYKNGYGIKRKDFPGKIDLVTFKKILEIATILSVCDYVDAATSRKTKVLDGSDKHGDLRQDLYDKYPDDHIVVDAALEAFEELALV